MRKLCLFFLLLPFWALGQQKAMFSQYMFNGLIINPAYSSIDEATNITGVYRKQWVGFEGSPNTQTVTFYTPIKESNTSVGAILMRDQIGEVITDNAAMATISQRVQIGEETYVALGVNAGISKYQANYSAITSGNALDPTFNDENDFRGTVGLGLMLFSQKFYAGIASPFFMQVKGNSSSATAFKPTYIAQGGYLTDIGYNLKFKPNLLFKYVNGAPLQMDINANFYIAETIGLGASWRSFDSLDFLAQIQLGPHAQIGYSYDLTTSQLATVNKGTHEIMLNFRIPIRGRNFPRCFF